MATDNARTVEILKAVSTFDMEEDFGSVDARKNLSVMFRDLILSDNQVLKEKIADLFQEVIMNDSESTRQFVNGFVDGIDDVIDDVESSEMSDETDDAEDEVIMPDEEPTDELPAEEPDVGAEAPVEEVPTEEVPEDLMASVNHTGYDDSLVEAANSFIWF